MATNNPKTASSRISVSRFGGICDHAGLALDAATNVRNFRILSDGTLEKRCGYLKNYTFEQPLRGLWEGVVSGESHLVLVVGNQIYLRNPTSGLLRAIYVLPTSSGDVSFFLYRDQLWLMDGSSLLRFFPSSRSFSVAQGYVPLYGYNWHPTALGEVKEPLNLVRNEIRIHYYNTNGSSTFNLPFTTQSIRYVKINGTPITTYNFQPGTSSFTIPVMYSTVGPVEVHIALDPIFSGRQNVLASHYAKVFRTPTAETAICYGSKAGYLLYRTTPVTDEMLHACSLAVDDADPFYIAKDSAFAVGSSTHPVTALCQFEDRMLVFNDESLWAIHYTEEGAEDDMEILPIRAGLGCASSDGVVLGGRYPIAATRAGIARLKFSTSNPNLCEPEILSAGIRNQHSREFLQNATLFWDEFRQELWAKDPSDSAGTVWICDPERDIWFCFNGIRAKRFFTLDGNIGFAEEYALCHFDEGTNTDNGEIFSAIYQSHFCDLSAFGAPRRTLRVSVLTQNDKGRLASLIETDRGVKPIKFRSNSNTSDLVHFERRLAMGRFRLLRYSFEIIGESRCRIYSLSIATNP